jgi:hypothetical protein
MEKSIAVCSAKLRLKLQTSIASVDIPVVKAGLNDLRAANRQRDNLLSHALVDSKRASSSSDSGPLRMASYDSN